MLQFLVFMHAGFPSDQPNETIFDLMSWRHSGSRPGPFISPVFLNVHQGKFLKCCPTDVCKKESDVPGMWFIWRCKWAAWIFLFSCSFRLFTVINWNHSAVLGTLVVLSCNFFQFLCVLTEESLPELSLLSSLRKLFKNSPRSDLKTRVMRKQFKKYIN